MRVIDLGQLCVPPEGFNMLMPSQQEVEEGRARDTTFITFTPKETKMRESSIRLVSKLFHHPKEIKPFFGKYPYVY